MGWISSAPCFASDGSPVTTPEHDNTTPWRLNFCPVWDGNSVFRSCTCFTTDSWSGLLRCVLLLLLLLLLRVMMPRFYGWKMARWNVESRDTHGTRYHKQELHVVFLVL